MKRGMMGLESPSLDGRGGMDSSSLSSSKPLSSKPPTGKSLSGGSSIQSAATTGGAPPVKNLGAKIITALRARRRGMGAPRAGRRM